MRRMGRCQVLLQERNEGKELNSSEVIEHENSRNRMLQLCGSDRI